MVFYATCAANQEDILEQEVKEAGATDFMITSGGVEWEGDLEAAYRFCLQSRCASRLLLALYENSEIHDADELYAAAIKIPWETWLSPTKTFTITNSVWDCPWLKNSHFAAIRLKDAIVDRIRDKYDGTRPDVSRDDPDVTFHISVKNEQVTYYVDFSGKSMSRRGYRIAFTDAILKESLAATLVKRSEVRKILENPQQTEPPVILDPFCGAGTVLIEAALWEGKVAPGLIDPDKYAFTKLPIHDEEIWQKVLDQAIKDEEEGASRKFKFYGWDIDPQAIEIAKKNAKAAGVDDKIEFAVKDFTQTTADDVPAEKGYIITDPPYGIRLESHGLESLYSKMGETINTFYGGWYVSILCGTQELLSFVNMKPDRTNRVLNGNIGCQIAHYYVFSKEEKAALAEKAMQRKAERLARPLSEGAKIVYDKLCRNLEHLRPLMEAQQVTNYRIYDADIPEYNAAIDVYGNKVINLQEYAAPASIPQEDTERRLQELIDATERATGIDIENIHVKERSRQKGLSQYQKLGNKNRFFIIHENGARYLVNYTDYLDTGIFLDHRPVRKMIGQICNGKRFLNLFCYTGTATVQAALGGALSTVSVDTSSTYLDWAQKNMELNGLTGMNHFFYKQDCLTYLYDTYDRFDVIFCDPPTFSNGTGRDEFDVLRDQRRLVKACMMHLAPAGVLIFSNNFRKFILDDYIWQDFDVRDISAETIGDDFENNQKIHQCYLIKERAVIKVNDAKVVRKVIIRKTPK
ncbi:MAG: bifunctional 23S rRNA (guanine(2069)-N(7))-methyltransferase RlmK/23S rRNA (guanine(2445)-N(2))-methyltransferase RlmL [Spirochaetia bacterium]|jgi:23S rRNA (guanine2445-N2)-methyltransferase / 23S rRNA (guanine2069-N7)-methyltransferase|nr:bifunctional 23S rRNA (guanine(2069)-N(7))-methyltransferase RlmK/23S rRNA (guanine(2445)-N(2))-methyltransferase RlmL [Spirochaetia bacterium]